MGKRVENGKRETRNGGRVGGWDGYSRMMKKERDLCICNEAFRSRRQVDDGDNTPSSLRISKQERRVGYKGVDTVGTKR